MIENWFLRITQLLVFIGVSGTAASYEITTNGTLIGVWGLIAAIGWTMAYAKVADWIIERRLRREAREEASDCAPTWLTLPAQGCSTSQNASPLRLDPERAR